MRAEANERLRQFVESQKRKESQESQARKREGRKTISFRSSSTTTGATATVATTAAGGRTLAFPDKVWDQIFFYLFPPPTPPPTTPPPSWPAGTYASQKFSQTQRGWSPEHCRIWLTSYRQYEVSSIWRRLC